jgi:hypothetical protein
MALLCNYDKQAASPALKIRCIKTLITLLSNLLVSSDPKFRRVKKANATLGPSFSIASERSGGLGGVGWAVLHKLGFTECKGAMGGDELELLPQNEDARRIARAIVELRLWRVAAVKMLQANFDGAQATAYVESAREQITLMSKESFAALSVYFPSQSPQPPKSSSSSSSSSSSFSSTSSSFLNAKNQQRAQIAQQAQVRRQQQQQQLLQRQKLLKAAHKGSSNNNSKSAAGFLSRAGQQLVDTVGGRAWLSSAIKRVQRGLMLGFDSAATSATSKKRKRADDHSRGGGVFKQAKLDGHGILTGLRFPTNARLQQTSGSTNVNDVLQTDISAMGMFNIANTCYLNAVVQAYFWIPAFRHTVLTFDGDVARRALEQKKKKSSIPSTSASASPSLAAGVMSSSRIAEIFGSIKVTEELSKLFAVLTCGRRFACSPYALYVALLDRNKLQMVANAQSDVAEFNSLLLDNVREAFQAVAMDKNLGAPTGESAGEVSKAGMGGVISNHQTGLDDDDPIGRLFFGTQRTLSRKGSNDKDILSVEHEADLVVELQDDILGLNLNNAAPAADKRNASSASSTSSASSSSSSLAQQQLESTGQGDDLVNALDSFCAWSTCTLSDRGQHERRTDFERLPPILTVHLPRVGWDHARRLAVMDATPLAFKDTLCLDPYVRVDNQDKDPNALGGIRLRRESIAKDLAHLGMDDAIQTVLGFTELAESRQKGGRHLLSTVPSGLHVDLQRLKVSIEERRRDLLEEDARLAKRMRRLLEQHGKCNYRLHAIILHRGNDDRPNAGHYYVHVRNLDRRDEWVTFNDDSVTRVKDVQGMMLEAFGYKRERKEEEKKHQQERSNPETLSGVGGEASVRSTHPHHCCARTLVYVRIVPASATSVSSGGEDPFFLANQFPRLVSPDDLHSNTSFGVLSPTLVCQPRATPLDVMTCTALAGTLPDSGGQARLQARLRTVERELQREISMLGAAAVTTPAPPAVSGTIRTSRVEL